MSRSVGYGPVFDIDLSEPLSAADREYLEARDPMYRAVLAEADSDESADE